MWVKTTSQFWVENSVKDDDFTNGLGYLVKERIIDLGEQIEQDPLEKQESVVPDWIRETTKWWIDGLVPEDQFLEGIKWMIKSKVIALPKSDSLESPENQCDENCLGLIIDSTATSQWKQTNLQTFYHCSGLPDTCSDDGTSTVKYREPSVKVGDKYEIRFSAIKEGQGIFTLPFDHKFVERNEPWVYNSDKLHRAIDYEIGDGWDSFKIRAAAPGTVVYKGYGWWSGNIIIISHDAQTENLYRTIYMHVRDGAENDCLNALNISLLKLEKEVEEGDRTQKNLDDYNLHLEKTGCIKNQMDTNHYHWGTNDQVIEVNEGDKVERGQMIAWAGNTGPGGKRGDGDPNVHLHIFFAKRDLTDNRWYLIDPYGIYAKGDCYPEGADEEINTLCSRHQVHWKSGHPKYPVPTDMH